MFCVYWVGILTVDLQSRQLNSLIRRKGLQYMAQKITIYTPSYSEGTVLDYILFLRFTPLTL